MELIGRISRWSIRRTSRTALRRARPRISAMSHDEKMRPPRGSPLLADCTQKQLRALSDTRVCRGARGHVVDSGGPGRATSFSSFSTVGGVESGERSACSEAGDFFGEMSPARRGARARFTGARGRRSLRVPIDRKNFQASCAKFPTSHKKLLVTLSRRVSRPRNSEHLRSSQVTSRSGGEGGLRDTLSDSADLWPPRDVGVRLEPDEEDTEGDPPPLYDVHLESRRAISRGFSEAVGRESGGAGGVLIQTPIFCV